VADVDLSFPRYVAARKGAASARAREGAHYAYGADLKIRSALEKVRPVTLSVEATLRFWQSVGKNRFLGSAVGVGVRLYPNSLAGARGGPEVLQIPPPTIYVSPQIVTLTVSTLGTADDAMIALGSPMVDHLTENELLFVIGRECGHIQNGHTVYLTALHYLTTAANMIIRFASQPAALALNSWSRRAEVTADRAGLLCVRDLDVATAAMVKMSVGSQRLFSNIDVAEYIQQLDEAQGGRGRFHELFATVPYLPKRVQALRLFAQTTYFRSVINAVGEEPGLSKEDCDAQVADLLAVFR
jgi:hypothetical protein